MEVFLEHMKGERAGALDHFAKDVIRVGRAQGLDLIFDDQGVSYEHAELRVRDGDFWLIDLGSTNGSFVNDERAQNARLKEGDHVRFGKKGPVVRFRLSNGGAAVTPPPKKQPSDEVLSDLPPIAPAPTTGRKRKPTMPEMPALSPLAVAPPPAPPARPSGRVTAQPPAAPGAAPLGPSAARVALARAASGPRPALPVDPPSAGSGSDSSGASDSSGSQGSGLQGFAGVRRGFAPPALKTPVVLAVLFAFLSLFACSLAVAFYMELEHRRIDIAAELAANEQLKRDNRSLKQASTDQLREQETRLRDQAKEQVDRLEGQLDKSRRNVHDEQVKVEELNRQVTRLRSELAQAQSVGLGGNGRNGSGDNRSWKQIESRLARSVVLVFCQFDMKKKDGSIEQFQCSGTGFFISKDGSLITNKHVVEPWKFRPLAVRLVQDELEVDMKSYKLAVWIAGARFANGNQLLLQNGFSTEAGTLERVREPLDRWMSLTLPGDKGTRLMKVHDDNSNEDLALLRARGGTFEPIPLRKSSDGPIEKLDPVLLVGFPAGPAILEKGIAETSAVPGTVRKVEETIYVSGGMIGGNSGGPVIDAEGRAVGVATRVVSGTESFGSCLKIEHVIELVDGGSW